MSSSKFIDLRQIKTKMAISPLYIISSNTFDQRRKCFVFVIIIYNYPGEPPVASAPGCAVHLFVTT